MARKTSHRIPHPMGGTATSKRHSQDSKADGRRTTIEPKTEDAFEAELFKLYQEWGSMAYWARRVYQMFTPYCQRYVGLRNSPEPTETTRSE
jgi:hypothetical protein